MQRNDTSPLIAIYKFCNQAISTNKPVYVAFDFLFTFSSNYIFNFIRRNKNDSSRSCRTIIKRKNKENSINQNKQSIKNTDTKNIITHI